MATQMVPTFAFLDHTFVHNQHAAWCWVWECFESGKEKPFMNRKYVGMGIGLGLSIGVALGAAMHNVM